MFNSCLQTDMDSTNLYAYISIIALFVCIPPAIIVSDTSLTTPTILMFATPILHRNFFVLKSLLVSMSYLVGGTSTDEVWLQ